MKNSKVIVLNGFNRGGTNIVWNILQSHPQVCSPIYETGQVLHSRGPNQTLNKIMSKIYPNRILIEYSFSLGICGYLIDQRFYNLKLQNFTHSENKFELEGVQYTKNKIENSVLCLKSSTTDMDLNELLFHIYDKIFFIGLIRNGYGLCDAWLKWKKISPEEVGCLYRKYGEKMIEDSKRFPNYIIVKFEDILKNPFHEASKLYEFAELKPTTINKLRLKAKKFLVQEGELKTSFGKVHQKYWFSPEDINQIIVPDISDIQARALSATDRKAFEREAKPILDYFGYTSP